MAGFKAVSKTEFDAFIAAYPRKLERNVTAICEPPVVSFNDFERAPYWPDSVVASYSEASSYTPEEGPGAWRVLADINEPVEDNGERETNTPLFDKNGVKLHEGDKVLAFWGWSGDGAARRIETILIRDKGTKYEHWSFESCHNFVRRFDMVKIEEQEDAT